jgi:uncharacterized protein
MRYLQAYYRHAMDEHISEYIKKQTVASVCCVGTEGDPYCFSCFYGFDAQKGLLYFKSSVGAKHTGILQRNRQVAGTIQPDALNKLHIKGVQFTGVVLLREDPVSVAGSSAYHRAFPFALAMPGDVYTIQLDTIKLTDNKLGFGKKLTWERESLQPA